MRRLTFIFALLLVSSVSFAQNTDVISNGAGIFNGAAIIPNGGCRFLQQTLPSGSNAVLYDVNLVTADCLAPTTFALSTGSFPGWATLNPATGEIKGIASTGTSTFILQVTDGRGVVALSGQLVVSIVGGGGGGGGGGTNGAPSFLAPLDDFTANGCTSQACEPHGTNTLCVGTPKDASLLPGGVCATSFTPANTANLQAALNALPAAPCGSVVNIQNITGYGQITIPPGIFCGPPNGSNPLWDWITGDLSDTTPPEGQRVSPCWIGISQSTMPYYLFPTGDALCSAPARHMPRIMSNALNGTPPVSMKVPSDASVAATGVRVQLVETTRDASTDIATNAGFDMTYDPGQSGNGAAGLPCSLNPLTGGKNALPVNALNCYNVQPSYITVSQVIIHGDAERQTARGWQFGGSRQVVFQDSFLYDINETYTGGGGDAQAIGGGGGHGFTGQGDWVIKNDFLGSSTQGVGLFCGNFCEPIAPTTLKDGVPKYVRWTQLMAEKNAYWNPQRGQTLNDTEVVEGNTVTPVPQPQQLVMNAPIEMQQGQTFQIQTAILYDTAGGVNRFTTAGGLGSVTIDAVACTFGANTTTAAVSSGSTVSVTSTAALAVNHSILVTGGNSSGQDYIGTITAISGTTVTVSPAMTGSAAKGVTVQDPVCIPGTDSQHGLLLKDGEHQAGSVPYVSNNQVTWKYIVCSTAANPVGECNVATTVTTHAIKFTYNALDPTTANFGGQHNVVAQANVTVLSGTPTHQIVVSPDPQSTPDLELQPSYPGAGTVDAFGNSRYFSMIFQTEANYTPGTLTWSVCDANIANCVVNGNATVGTINATLSGLPAGAALYTSGSQIARHTIKVTDAGVAAGNFPAVDVTRQASILDYDLKPNAGKNVFEVKCLNIGQLDNSLLEYSYGGWGNGGGQKGQFWLGQPINQGFPTSGQTQDGSGNPTNNLGPEHINDFFGFNIHGLHVAAGFIIDPLATQSLGERNLAFSNILIEDENPYKYSNGWAKNQFDTFAQIAGATGTTLVPWSAVTFPTLFNVFMNHITSVGGTGGTTPLANGRLLSLANNTAQFPMTGMTLKNSIIMAPGAQTFSDANGDSPSCNQGTGTGTNNSEPRALAGAASTQPCYAPGYVFGPNALVDNTTPLANFTSTIYTPLDSDTTLFPNYNAGSGGSYCPPVGSHFAAGGLTAADDGTALGVDCSAIAASDAAARSGTRTP